MGSNVQTTFALLTKTENEAAIDLLVAALSASRADIRARALRALVDRHNPAGHAEVLKRLHQLGDDWQALLGQSSGKMTLALRDALLSAERQTVFNACQVLLALHEYDLMPALVTKLQDTSHSHGDLAAKALLDLADLLYQEIAGPRDYSNRRDPQVVRRHVTTGLEQAVARYSSHHRKEVVEAFLLLADRENCTLQQILHDPLHSSYQVVMEALTYSERGGVLRLLLSFLDHPQPPGSALSALARRSDLRFIRHLLKKIGFEALPVVAHNLKRIESIPWLQPAGGVLEKLDDAGQHSAIKLLMASGVPRLAAFPTLEHLAIRGTAGGRRAAYMALASFQGAEANALCLRGLNDADPLVQAAAAKQLRQRSVPGAMIRLVELLNSRHEAVRSAVRESLSEFQFKRFLASFDLLEPAVRLTTGAIVRKADPDAIAQLRDELRSSMRTRRLRAIDMSVALGAVGDAEAELIELLMDEDHMIRGEAARVLVGSDSTAAKQALAAAAFDRNELVQDIARRSLEEISGRKHLMPVLPTEFPAQPIPTEGAYG